jgi:cytochrome c oxidase subunit 1
LLRKYIFSTDHKVIGLQYALTSMFFLLVGFSLVVLIRWQLAYPGDASSAPCTAPSWCSSGRTAGLRRVRQTTSCRCRIGAPDMAFPRLNMASYQAFFAGGVVMLASFFVPGGAASTG